MSGPSGRSRKRKRVENEWKLMTSRSPTPEEHFEETNLVWKVNRITDHHEGPDGRIQYKIEWANWKRKDGTNTTWDTSDSVTFQDAPNLIPEYERRLDAAKKAYGSALPVSLIRSKRLQANVFDLLAPSPVHLDDFDSETARQLRLAGEDSSTYNSRQRDPATAGSSRVSASRAPMSRVSASESSRGSQTPSVSNISTAPTSAALSAGARSSKPPLPPQPQTAEKSTRKRRERSPSESMEALTIASPSASPPKARHIVQTSSTSVRRAPDNQSSTKRLRRHISPAEETSGIGQSYSASNRKGSLIPSNSSISHTRDRANSTTEHSSNATKRARKPPSLLEDRLPPPRKKATSSSSRAIRRTSLGSSPYPPDSRGAIDLTLTDDDDEPVFISTQDKRKGKAKALSLRELLSAAWTDTAHSAGAASITFVNEVDDEELPEGITSSFKYLESTLEWDPGTKKKQKVSRPAAPKCRHERDSVCDMDAPDECGCQSASDIRKHAFAYSQTGKFLFNNYADKKRRLKTEVIECNEYCTCANSCPNRASQRPRTFPIEVFKTAQCGWGARATVKIAKGTVLGFFTGRWMTREQSDERSPELTEYTFPNDFGEDLVTAQEHLHIPKYSICALISGNWTRFLNHSCDANLELYNAAVEFPSEWGLSRLVFAARRDIPPRTELTLDYNPADNEESPDRMRCSCGAADCRGYI